MKKYFLFLMVALLFNACNLFNKKNQETIKLFPIMIDDKWGYIDTKGIIVIPAQFQEADLFADGLARVGVEKDSVVWYGFINDKGDLVIPCKYKDATSFSEEIAWVVKPKGHPVAIDKSGKELFTLKDAEYVTSFKEGLAAYSQINSHGDPKWGFCDKKGKTAVFPTYKSVENFSEGLALVSDTNDKFGYIDIKGNMVIPYQFDIATNFQKGMATICLGDKWGIIDKKGKIILNPQFDYLKIIEKNLIVCKIGDQFGFCDKEGKMLVNPQYDRIAFNNDYENISLFAICQNKKWGFVNKSGEIKIQPQFENAGVFQNGIAPVIFNGKVGFIDEKGSYVVNPRYDSVNVFKNTILRTQFFDPQIVVNLIDLINHKGIAIDASFSDIMTKFNMDESDFSKYSQVTEIEGESKSSLDYLLQYCVLGSPYKKYQQGYYYTWTEYEFNPSRKIDGIACFLQLINNAKDRVEDVLSEIENILGTYETEDRSTPDKTIKIYSSPKQSFFVYSEKDSQTILIFIGDSDLVETGYKIYDNNHNDKETKSQKDSNQKSETHTKTQKKNSKEKSPFDVTGWTPEYGVGVD